MPAIVLRMMDQVNPKKSPITPPMMLHTVETIMMKIERMVCRGRDPQAIELMASMSDGRSFAKDEIRQEQDHMTTADDS